MTKHSGIFVGRVLGGMLGKFVVALVLALIAAYIGIAKIAHLDPFSSQNTISTTVVLGKLTKLEQLQVATRSYRVDVKITQSVQPIPCFFICNQMELKGSGTDDATVNLATLSKNDVSIDQAAATVTIQLPAPVIGAPNLNPADCTISSSHGILNGPTLGFRNNPNGYRPLYAAAERQIYNAALHDQGLLTAGEQSARATFTRVLGVVGVKQVFVDFG